MPTRENQRRSDGRMARRLAGVLTRLRSLGRPRLIAIAVVFASLALLGFVPLFGGPGYEQSLATGLIAPSVAATATAIELSGVALPPLACVARGVATGLLLACVSLLTAIAHGIRVGMCDFFGDLEFFALGAGFGAVMGGVWGAVVAEACRRRRARRLACVVLALAGPLAGIAISVGRFIGSPMIFAYDPFVGFFSGTLYDTIVDGRRELLSYRAGSLSTLAGVALIASTLVRNDTGGLQWRTLRGDPRTLARLGLGILSLAASVVLCIEGPRLGHWQTAGSIARALGGRTSGSHCDVLYPDSLLKDQAALLVRDCEEELAADEKVLGASLGGRLTEYVFRDAAQKRALMGAAQTSIAKPWRREVYVQLAAYPHPVLGHEIAHVVSGSFGRGPFRIAGAAGGLLPNPGLIEGVAVAASPDDDELIGSQWARAMLDLGALPPVRKLFSLDFLGENAAKSYTIAGAFVGWVLQRWGAPVVRAWYGGASLEELTNTSWDALDDEFRQSLRALAMPPEASAYAMARFERPSVWARRCPHVVDTLNRDADRCRDDKRFEHAVELYDQALARDPHDWHALYERARVELRYVDVAKGRAALELIATSAQAPRTVRDRAQEALADDDVVRGRNDEAVRSYRELQARTLDEDVARTLDVKARSVEDPVARRSIIDLLMGDPGRPVDPWLGALALGTWAERTAGVLPTYLVGKNLALHEEYARAASWLDRVLEADGAGARLGPEAGREVGREILRQRAICACVLDDQPALDRVRVLASTAGSPFEQSPGGGRREWLMRLIARCRRG